MQIYEPEKIVCPICQGKNQVVVLEDIGLLFPEIIDCPACLVNSPGMIYKQTLKETVDRYEDLYCAE